MDLVSHQFYWKRVREEWPVWTRGMITASKIWLNVHVSTWLLFKKNASLSFKWGCVHDRKLSSQWGRRCFKRSRRLFGRVALPIVVPFESEFYHCKSLWTKVSASWTHCLWYLVAGLQWWGRGSRLFFFFGNHCNTQLCCWMELVEILQGEGVTAGIGTLWIWSMRSWRFFTSLHLSGER